LAIALAVMFALIGSIVSLVRYWQYDAYYIDFGIFDQAIWEVSRLRAPIIEHFIVGGKWIFADHFNPSIFLLSPLYWLTDRSEIILVAQAVAVGASGFVLYLIAKEITKHAYWPLAIMVCYFSFVGLQNAVITEFHELTVMTLAFALTWWAAIHRKVWLYFLFLIITLGFKEALFPLGLSTGIGLFILQKDWRKIAVATIVLSIVWGIVSIKFIIPHFSEGIYIYSPNLPDSWLGKISSLVDQDEKRRTLLYSFASFGFLPFFSPAFWLSMLQDYALRFMPIGFTTRWGLGMHYNAQSAVILCLSSIFGVRFLVKRAWFKRYSLYICIGLVVFVLGINRFMLHGPFHLVYNPAFYQHTRDFAFLDTLVRVVPKNASVMTQNNIAGHFTHQKVYLLKANYEAYKPAYVVMDMRAGQGPTNFFGSNGKPEDILAALKLDPKYRLVYSTEDQYVFGRR
jgi:uncharacterized membrane protein